MLIPFDVYNMMMDILSLSFYFHVIFLQFHSTSEKEPIFLNSVFLMYSNPDVRCP